MKKVNIMYCEIVKAGFECNNHECYDLYNYYVGVNVVIYKRFKIFGKRKTYQLIWNKSKKDCLIEFNKFMKENSLDNVMDIIKKKVRKEFEDKENENEYENLINELIDEANNSLQGLVGRKFEI